jgi:arylsulfatase A-like enzyme
MKLRHLWQDGSLDVFHFKAPLAGALPSGTEEVERSVSYAPAVAQACAEYLVRQQPRLCGIHFPDPDDAGHKFGWGSAEQKAAFQRADTALGLLVTALKESGLSQSSVLLISADHGGHGRSHGERIPDDMLIPWIAWGRGVKPHFEIQKPVSTVDTAATALWLLGVPIPEEMDGKPVREAFDFEGASR